MTIRARIGANTVAAGICRPAILLAVSLIGGIAHAASGEARPEIRTSDVELFYRVYDAAGGSPSAAVLQREYLDAGSDGVRQFVPDRIKSADALAEFIAKHSATYERARACAAELPDVRTRVLAALAKLGELVPTAKFPPVTILIGRGNSAGTTGAAGVLVGLETVCSADWLPANLEDRLVYLIAHEYVHVQQPIVQRNENPTDGAHTVLEASLVEGVADFVGELISGSTLNVHLQRWTAGREAEIASAFLKEMDGTDMSHWLYNGVGTPEKPGDLGYWVGYRIAKCYYARASDKNQAVRQLVALDDPKKVFERSGWPEAEKGGGCSGPG